MVCEGERDDGTTTTICACAHPAEPNTLVTGLSNGLVKLWDLGYTARETTGVLSLAGKPPTCVTFLDNKTLAIGIDRTDTGGASGALFLAEISDAPTAIANDGRTLAGPFARKIKITKKIHNIGKGCVTSAKMSPDGTYLACSSSDGNVYFFKAANDYEPIGLAACHTSNPVVSVVDFDWSRDSAFMRTFGPVTANDGSMLLSFFSIAKNAGEEPATPLVEDMDLEPITSKKVQWVSASSPAAFEAAGCHLAYTPGVGSAHADLPADVELAAVNNVSVRGAQLAAGYTDGSVRMFNFPARANEFASITGAAATAPVRAVFLTSGLLACISDADGTISVYK